jgi:hypothetical protein
MRSQERAVHGRGAPEIEHARLGRGHAHSSARIQEQRGFGQARDAQELFMLSRSLSKELIEEYQNVS